MTSLNWVDDATLTDIQKKLKWYLYTEVDLTYELEDIGHALDSLLADVLDQLQSSAPSARIDK